MNYECLLACSVCAASSQVAQPVRVPLESQCNVYICRMEVNFGQMSTQVPAEQWEVGHAQLGYWSHADSIYTSWLLYSTVVECCTQRCYCELVTNVVYTNFQDVLVPLGAVQCSREYKKFPESISTHFNCSFMQLKQTSDQENNSLLGDIYIYLCTQTAFICVCMILAKKTEIGKWAVASVVKRV